MHTTITYNGVLIKDVLTDGIEATAAKDSTGVDQAGVRYVCNFSGVVHQAAQDKMGKKLPSFRGGLQELLQALMKDRRRFTMKIGGQTVIDVGPGAAEPNAPKNQVMTDLDMSDIANGPMTHVQVMKITAGISAIIRFTIEYTIPNCGGPTTVSTTRGRQAVNNRTGLVNFRFWIAEDVDCVTWLTTRTYQGRIRVAHKNIAPHQLARTVTIPPLQDGFQRRIVQWHESADGLHLDFTFQDVERIAAAPWNRFANVGATAWEGTLTASTQSMGATGLLDLKFSLTGPKTTSKPDLIAIGFLVCQSKVKLIEAIQGVSQKRASAFLESLAVTEDLAENRVSFDCQVRHTGDSNMIAGLLSVGADQVLGRPLGNLGINYNPEKHFNPGPSAGVGGLFLSVLQTPCAPAKMPNPQTPKERRYQSSSNRSSDQDSYANGRLNVSRSNVSQSHLEAIYLEYQMDSDLQFHTGQIGLATGAANGSRADTMAIVSLHRPTCTREIRIDASRLDATPELPDFSRSFLDFNGIRHTPIGEPDLVASVPQLSADSRNFLHRVQLTVRYAMSRAPRAGETLPVGTLPYRTSSNTDQRRVIPRRAFVAPESILR